MKVGERVGAMVDANAKVARFLGYGTYEGETVPSEKAGGFGPLLRALGQKNPTLKLDNGKIVYGCECWWGTEAEINRQLEGLEVVNIDIDEFRKEAAEAEDAEVKEPT